ncbi:hypothetical protein [uncultured Psychroserpens sp.]|uniref:hypothetical protein n=1 Tax=uncultured Psychroserpens sp. TaxID=255436 RepID=UPI0026180D8F|nr:hypothetical protein [uncultured Psychroserpens sp.]
MRTVKIVTTCICFALLLMNTQCDEDNTIDSPCDQIAIIDNAFYQSAESDEFSVVDVVINDNCLSIDISASGCDGNTWSMVLVDSGDIAESSPPQRFLKLVFTNDEDCLAVIGQERSFDLSPLQTNDENEVILHIEGFTESITYTYN